MSAEVRVPGEAYLVGGAVRDKLLGLPVKEKDWVVVGATPEAMLDAGFKQVGADFPVFLHPDTKEEYALARTERKTGGGYHGFVTETGKVGIEEDLKRRDLTINAMAEGGDGELIDPFGGEKDLERRVLRHVSPAFIEDPLRVLRVARFMAQLAPFDFYIGDETLGLMRNMVADGDLQELTRERVWTEIRKACRTRTPSLFFATITELDAWRSIATDAVARFFAEDFDDMMLNSAAQADNISALHVVTALAAQAASRATEHKANLTPWLQQLGASNAYVKRARVTYEILFEISCYLMNMGGGAFDLHGRPVPIYTLKVLRTTKTLHDPKELDKILKAWSFSRMHLRPDWQENFLAHLRIAQKEIAALDTAAITEGLRGAEAGEAIHAAQHRALGNLLRTTRPERA